MLLKSNIIREKKYLENELKIAKYNLRDLPKGKIAIVKRGDNILYRLNNKGISNNKPLVRALKKRTYYEHWAEILEQDIAALDDVLEHYIDPMPSEVIANITKKHRHAEMLEYSDVSIATSKAKSINGQLHINYDQTPPSESYYEYEGVIYVKTHINPDEQMYTFKTVLLSDKELYDWMNAPYKKNTGFPENLQYRTKCGVVTRSKSEALTADALYARGIPFRYEQIVNIDGKTFAIDFVILNRDGSYTFWEHLGKTNDESYNENNIGKLVYFLEHGLVPWRNLIITCDFVSTGFDSGLIDKEIESKLMHNSINLELFDS